MHCARVWSMWCFHVGHLFWKIVLCTLETLARLMVLLQRIKAWNEEACCLQRHIVIPSVRLIKVKSVDLQQVFEALTSTKSRIQDRLLDFCEVGTIDARIQKTKIESVQARAKAVALCMFAFHPSRNFMLGVQ